MVQWGLFAFLISSLLVCCKLSVRNGIGDFSFIVRQYVTSNDMEGWQPMPTNVRKYEVCAQQRNEVRSGKKSENVNKIYTETNFLSDRRKTGAVNRERARRLAFFPPRSS